MEFIESRVFEKNVNRYLLNDKYLELCQFLAKNPDFGQIIPGTGGFRKIRWNDSRRNKGKRGGIRIIYYYFLFDREIFLANIYDKNEAKDLTSKVKKELKKFITEEKRIRKKQRNE